MAIKEKLSLMAQTEFINEIAWHFFQLDENKMDECLQILARIRRLESEQNK